MHAIEIAGRRIAADTAPYVIAELGINHGGDVAAAHAMLDSAADCGAAAVKLQTFVSEEFISRSSQFFKVLKDAELAPDEIRALVAHARARGITLFSAAFDEKSADLLDASGVPAFKVASGDITHLPLLRHIARKGKPVVLSTGGATMGEIETAIGAMRGVSPGIGIALLHCVSNYPTKPQDLNLACIRTMVAQFALPVGFSDHTQGTACAIAAVALGAAVIEKHFTLDRSAPGPDHALSCDPGMFRDLVAGVAEAWHAVGRTAKAPVEPVDFIPLIRRSLTAREALAAGTVLAPAMLAVKRPGTGIAPGDLERVAGRRLARALAADETLTWAHLA